MFHENTFLNLGNEIRHRILQEVASKQRRAILRLGQREIVKKVNRDKLVQNIEKANIPSVKLSEWLAAE